MKLVDLKLVVAAPLIDYGTLTILAACTQAEPPPAEEIRPVCTIPIGGRAEGDTLALTGTVHAQSEINLAFRIESPVTQGALSHVVARLAFDPSRQLSISRYDRGSLFVGACLHFAQETNASREIRRRVSGFRPRVDVGTALQFGER